MTRRLLGWWTALALAAAYGRADAAVVCAQKKSGHLSLRPSVCAKKETPVDVAALALPDGAVSPAKLSPEARSATGSVALQGGTSATTPTKLDSFTVAVPGPGTLLVTVAGMLTVDADSSTSAAVTATARIGLCDTPDSDSQCAGTYTQVKVQDADDTDDDNTTPAFVVTRTVVVAGAGPRTFYVNGEAPPPPAAGVALWVDPIVGAGPVASAVFVPASLGVTRP